MGLAENIKYQRETMKCNCRLLDSASKIAKRITELEAENKKLIEGQQAKFEAGS